MIKCILDVAEVISHQPWVSHAGFPKRLVVIDIWPRQPPHAPSRGFDGRRSQLSSPLCAEAGRLMSRMEYRASRIDLALYSTWPCECALSGKGEEVNAGLGMGNTRKRGSEDRLRVSERDIGVGVGSPIGSSVGYQLGTY
jgi:hypothetical protein